MIKILIIYFDIKKKVWKFGYTLPYTFTYLILFIALKNECTDVIVVLILYYIFNYSTILECLHFPFIYFLMYIYQPSLYE